MPNKSSLAQRERTIEQLEVCVTYCHFSQEGLLTENSHSRNFHLLAAFTLPLTTDGGAQFLHKESREKERMKERKTAERDMELAKHNKLLRELD